MKRTDLHEKADGSDPEALLEFGLRQLQKYYKGEYSGYTSEPKTKKKVDEAITCIMKSVAQEYPRAYYEIGALYHAGKYPYYDEMDSHEAVRWYNISAEKGYAPANNQLGRCYQLGNGTRRNMKKAFQHYRAAAGQNHPEAQNSLGLLYFLGKGVKQSHRLAFKWIKLASEENLPKALHNMGWFYENGVIVDKDYKQALTFFQAAADKGLSCTQHKMYVYYRDGIGVGKNLAFANEWFDKIKRKPLSVGFEYFNELGIIPEKKEALFWLYKAAIKGCYYIYDILSTDHKNGYIVEKNYVKSLKYFLLAKHYLGEESYPYKTDAFNKFLPASLFLQVIAEANKYLDNCNKTEDEQERIKLLREFIDSDIQTVDELSL